MNQIIAYTCIGIGLLSGCSNQEPHEEVHPVSWYKEHKEERIKMLAKCNENPGELQESPNCINAKKAKILSLSGELPTFN